MKRIEKAITILQPLTKGQELPSYYQARLRQMMDRLQILAMEVGRWQAGPAKTEAGGTPELREEDESIRA